MTETKPFVRVLCRDCVYLGTLYRSIETEEIRATFPPYDVQRSKLVPHYECRREPIQQNAPQSKSFWPDTYLDGWCGKGERKQSEEPAPPPV